jgi:uncharacterized RDD family membrane protein YckC
MRKISEIKEVRNRTVHKIDAAGKRVAYKETYTGFRTVNSISGLKRFLHFFIDSVIILVVLYILNLSFEFEFTKRYFFSTIYIIPSLHYLILYFLYFFILEFYFQTTIGKTLTNSLVIDIYGNKPTLKTSLLRSLIRLIPWDPYTFIYEDRGWHDKWTDTYVVNRAELKTLKDILSTDKEEEKN